MATFTSRLALRMPDPTDLVSVTSDVNASMSILDAAVGFMSVTSLPTTSYSGKGIMVSTDSYRSYFNNGTAPASAGWVEVPNASGTFGSDLKLASGAKLVIGADTNLFRNSANVLRTNDALTVDGTLTASTGLTVTAGGITVSGGELKLVGGTTTFRNKLSSQTTVSNTLSEIAIASMTIPANDPVVGATYRIHAWGTLVATGTPQITFRSRVGSIAQVTLGAVTVRSGISDGTWDADYKIAFSVIGGSGSVSTSFKAGHNFVTGVTTYTKIGPIVNGGATIDTTASSDLTIYAFWNTANASNTLICKGFTAERVS